MLSGTTVQADQEQEKNRKNLTPKAMMPNTAGWWTVSQAGKYESTYRGDYMPYVIAGLMLTVLFLCGYILKLKGYRITRAKPDEVPEKEKIEAQQKIEAFDEMMNYNLDLALKRRQVS